MKEAGSLWKAAREPGSRLKAQAGGKQAKFSLELSEGMTINSDRLVVRNVGSTLQEAPFARKSGMS